MEIIIFFVFHFDVNFKIFIFLFQEFGILTPKFVMCMIFYIFTLYYC